jgi:hypothetical protein
MTEQDEQRLDRLRRFKAGFVRLDEAGRRFICDYTGRLVITSQSIRGELCDHVCQKGRDAQCSACPWKEEGK